MAEVKFCENNFIHGTDKIVENLEKAHKDVQVSVEPCLGYCGDCAGSPYALVNEEFIQAETVDELYEKIEELL